MAAPQIRAQEAFESVVRVLHSYGLNEVSLDTFRAAKAEDDSCCDVLWKVLVTIVAHEKDSAAVSSSSTPAVVNDSESVEEFLENLHYPRPLDKNESSAR